VVLGFDTLDEYVHQAYYIGTAIGRCCNRIRGAALTLNGHRYQLSINEGRHHLHGGFQGFHDVVWETIDSSEQAIHFRYVSPNGEEGYPGNLETDIIYSLTHDNEVAIHYTAVCDADTIVNLTNHSYFNLNGHDNGSIEDHELQIFAELYTEIDGECIPTGIIAPVDGTPLDFRVPMRIAERLNSSHEQMCL
jgi:aldose 1-epimerase